MVHFDEDIGELWYFIGMVYCGFINATTDYINEEDVLP